MSNCLRRNAAATRLRSGFSLVEVLTVVVILAIIALLVLPSGGESASVRVQSAARLLIADIEHAQIESIGNGLNPYVIVFHADAGGYHLAQHPDPATPAVNPTTDEPYVTRFGEGRAAALLGVTIDIAALSGKEILKFAPTGVLDHASDALITLRCGDERLEIVVPRDTGEPELRWERNSGE